MRLRLPLTGKSTKNGIMPLSQTHPKPDWLRIRPPGGENYSRIKLLLRQLSLHTVCEEAHCPNVAECWGGGTATVMLMGDTCTRACRFCHVKSGNPKGALDAEEPMKVAHAVNEWRLKYVVLTSVNRDDLPDGGADHFARTVEAIKKLNASIIVEVLVPDFNDDECAIGRLVSSGAEVLGHNIETIERLTPKVRDHRATYRQSLSVLRKFKELSGGVFTKSSIMVGLGENKEELGKVMDDLRSVGVDILTIGQYLRPSSWHLPVEEYLSPETFKELEAVGVAKGFQLVCSGPLVRSSYRAGEFFVEKMLSARHEK
ncbi:MAG: lipoyl synthase [Deltaproteobacteria bacterium]|nr:lipoyl synthase [Deltaproteobacteria bacterium]